MISSQLPQQIPGFDEVITEQDSDFKSAGLKNPSVIRIFRIAIVDRNILLGSIGKIDPSLKDEGYKESYSQEVFSRLTTDTDYLLSLDFMFVDDQTLSKIIDRGTETEIAGQKFIVPSLNHLIALKLHAIKHNPEPRKEKDLWDIIELARANEIEVGGEDFRQTALKYGTPDLYREIKERV